MRFLLHFTISSNAATSRSQRRDQTFTGVVVSMEERARRVGDNLSGFIIIDEDFFLHKERAREYLELVREHQDDRSIMAFGSVKGLLAVHCR